jgi:hypothetical protein
MTEKLLSYSKIDVNMLEKLSMGGYSALHHACALGIHTYIQIHTHPYVPTRLRI